jgi:predicted DsbA family dithiol-disulfide isomerase
LEEEFDVTVDWRGFELHPETPVGGMPIWSLYSSKQTGARQEYMRNFAAGFGIENMASPDTLPNTRRILAMAEYAREMGKLNTFRALAMQARWQDGCDLGDSGVLGNLAAASGLDPQQASAAGNSPDYLARVDSRRAEAERMGITGVPTFIIGEKHIVGCQPYPVLARAVLEAGVSRRKPA